MDHSAVLERLCRVCGRSVVTKSVKTKHACKDHLDELYEVFGVAAGIDDPLKHPTHFCHSCRAVLYKAKATKHTHQHQTILYNGWCIHVDGSCGVCDHHTAIQRGGRPKKIPTPGRPSYASPRYCIDHVQEIAPPPHTHHEEVMKVCNAHNQSVPLSDLQCSICCDILQSPVELVTCGKVVCADCLCSHLRCQNNSVCPCCHEEHLNNFTTIRKAPPLVLRLLENLCIVCAKCNSHMQLKVTQEHTEINCKPQDLQVASHSSVDDLLQQPLTAPLTAIEQKLQTRLARRSLSTCKENIIQLKTGGKVNREHPLIWTPEVWPPLYSGHLIRKSKNIP